MIVNLAKGALWALIVSYDTEQDSLLTRTQDEFGGSEPAYWRPHPSNPNVLVGYVRDDHDVREWYDDPPKLEAYDRAVALKLLRASIEPDWDDRACLSLHQMGFGEYDGIPGIGCVNELWHARQALAHWFADRQLNLFGR